MSMFKKLWNKSDTIKEKKAVVKAPIDGQLGTLESLNDGVFSEKLLGPGCVITSNSEKIVAPFTGSVVMIASTKHAIGLMSAEGVEVLIHVGLDTVNMNGDGFNINVINDECITAGQLLMTFSKEKIKKSGYSDEVIMIVTNSKKFRKIVCVEQNTINEQDDVLLIDM